MAMDFQAELNRLYRRIGEIRREMAAQGQGIYGPKEFVDETIDWAARGFQAVGFGPTRVARYRRGMEEVTQYGPLGFIQRDVMRIQTAINQAPSVAEDVRQRVNQLAEKAVNLPLDQARNTRRTLQRYARDLGLNY